ncbi:PepSY domain-containing protein [Streptomyces sp. NPDC002990]
MDASFRLRSLAVCLAVSSALVLTACGEGDRDPVAAAAPTPASRQPSPTGTAPLTEDQRERMQLVPAAKISWQQAMDTAVGEVPQSRLVESELTSARDGATGASPTPGNPFWDITVATQDGTAHDVQVDAVTGSVTQSRVEPGHDADDKRELAQQLRKATVTPQQAVQTSTGRKQGTVTALELDDDMWSVDIVTPNDWNKTTYDIDAAKGNVVREHVDRD